MPQQVCRGIGMLTSGSYAGQSNLETLMPHIEGVIGFMLASTADDGEGVAIEAVDFWHTLVHTFSPAQAAGREALRAHLPELLPVLLNRMVYEDDDPALEFAEDDEDRLDDESEVGPMSAGARAGEEDEDEDDEYGNETGGGDSYYTLRKGAGRSLDAMANVYADAPPLVRAARGWPALCLGPGRGFGQLRLRSLGGQRSSASRLPRAGTRTRRCWRCSCRWSRRC